MKPNWNLYNVQMVKYQSNGLKRKRVREKVRKMMIKKRSLRLKKRRRKLRIEKRTMIRPQSLP